MAKLGYARVSTNQQKLDIQIAALKAQQVRNDRLFSDKASGKDIDRPGLAKLLSRAEDGDEVLVTKLDRLGRNTLDMITIVEQLHKKGVSVSFLDDNLSTKGDVGYMLITILSAVAQADRNAPMNSSANVDRTRVISTLFERASTLSPLALPESEGRGAGGEGWPSCELRPLRFVLVTRAEILCVRRRGPSLTPGPSPSRFREGEGRRKFVPRTDGPWCPWRFHNAALALCNGKVTLAAW